MGVLISKTFARLTETIAAPFLTPNKTTRLSVMQAPTLLRKCSLNLTTKILADNLMKHPARTFKILTQQRKGGDKTLSLVKTRNSPRRTRSHRPCLSITSSTTHSPPATTTTRTQLKLLPSITGRVQASTFRILIHGDLWTTS